MSNCKKELTEAQKKTQAIRKALNDVLLITFTNAGAAEMKARCFSKLLAEGLDAGCGISALSARICRADRRPCCGACRGGDAQSRQRVPLRSGEGLLLGRGGAGGGAGCICRHAAKAGRHV